MGSERSTSLVAEASPQRSGRYAATDWHPGARELGAGRLPALPVGAVSSRQSERSCLGGQRRLILEPRRARAENNAPGLDSRPLGHAALKRMLNKSTQLPHFPGHRLRHAGPALGLLASIRPGIAISGAGGI